METGRQYQDHVEDATVLIRNGVIDTVGPSSQVVIPADSVVYNAEGGEFARCLNPILSISRIYLIRFHSTRIY